jgi:hypothetical protein
MKDHAQLLASVERFQRAFWNREETERPPVGVLPERCFLPVNYLKAPLTSSVVVPSDVTRELIRTDYEDMSFGRRVFSDDFIPYSAPWRGVPWLEAICGCPVIPLPGALVPEHIVDAPGGLADLTLPAGPEWIECLRAQTAALVETKPPDCWVSPTILRGTSDVLAAIRGQSGFFLDLYDAPELLAETGRRVKGVLLDVLDAHFAAVPPHLGGYAHIFGFWAPGPTIAIQEDMMGMCDPGMYRDVFMDINAEIVEHVGPYTFLHMHSTGYQHHRHVLEIPGLAGIQMVVENIGPSLDELAPVFQEILERTRLVVLIDSHFDELPGLLKKLPRDGFYLTVMDKFIPTEAAFQAFVAANW